MLRELYKLWLTLRTYLQFLELRQNYLEMSTQTNPFAEWSSSSQENTPSVLGALPSISVAPSLPISISDGLVLQFAPDVLNCIVRGPHSRSMFIISSDAQTATFRTNEKQIFALVRFEPLALVEIPGCTPRQRVRDWLRLSPDHRLVGCTIIL